MTLVKREQSKNVIKMRFGGDWIDVRDNRMYGDTVTAQRAAASRVAQSDKGGEAVAITFDVSAFNLSLLTTMIVAWSDNEPINEETIQLLDDDVVSDILEVITKEARDEEEKAPLEKTSTSPSALDAKSSSPAKEKSTTGQ